MKNVLAKLLIFSFLTSFFFIIPSCDKDERIPYVHVNIVIYPDLPEYNSIKTPGNHLYLTGGYNGIVLYCLYTDTYMAYERNCPYKPSESDAILDVDSSGLHLVCRGCKSKFAITDGTKLEGPSKYSLVTYNTVINNNALYIYSNY